mmetsp:Transcript_24261/g.52331  ORF Transcript_24261/g.52331 Transcript_24261/m.52331 type:complete len:574 (-) Transcript_24261:204-1925(-)|eukprot:CAMPEP_0172307660 /NCGR_PEP_ID=MMETSP1058-20130122/8467_1 /TAXON_ID=83371 /ORGANISM="Detonula confervacea, Strain CCMP 353" /LENGTH=573 /DNA_ID=CAMNT_0013019883 /DNA_START=140 /DNA_END=1861 /DNA_ORIENTATION=+
MKNLLGIISLQIAISSSSTVIAYIPPARRSCHSRRLTSPTPSFTFTAQKRPSRGERYLQKDEGDGCSQHNILDSISYRPVKADDLPECYKIEAASYPEDEAASSENIMYRHQFAGDYFWCATLPTVEANTFSSKQEATDKDDIIIGFICSTRCDEFTEESMSTHDPSGSILAIHSVVVDATYRRQGIASAMMQNYLKQMLPFSNLVANTMDLGFRRTLLLAKSNLLSFYVDNGFMVLRPSPIVHGKQTWYELEARQDSLEKVIRMQATSTGDVHESVQPSIAKARIFETSRSTANPDEGLDGNAFANGRDQRREKLHNELKRLDIDPNELEAHPETFGTAAMRTYNSFLLPKSAGALAVTQSPTRPRVVANNISFLVREYRADQEQWLRNVDRNRGADASQSLAKASDNDKHPITIILDNIRSAHNVGNILRLAEAAGVDSVRLCGMTPRPPHPKVLKTAMGAAEYVSLGEDKDAASTLQTVLDLKANGYKVYGVETTENAISLWNTPIPDDDTEAIAYVFGNELIGVDVQVLRECDGIICLPTYGNKNSLNVATCVGIIVWDTLRKLKLTVN